MAWSWHDLILAVDLGHKGINSNKSSSFLDLSVRIKVFHIHVLRSHVHKTLAVEKGINRVHSYQLISSPEM